LSNKLSKFDNYDIISFTLSEEHIIKYDVNYNILIGYLKARGITNFDIKSWPSSTNHCMKRTILEDFVNWYYPSCLSIKDRHPIKFGYYHERAFPYYSKNKLYKHLILNNAVKHIQLRSYNT